MRFDLAPEALADLDAIVAYLTGRSPSAVAGLEARIGELFGLIRGNRYVGRATDRRHVRVVNAKPYPYLIFYKATASEIRVLRIMHGARSPRLMPARPR